MTVQHVLHESVLVNCLRCCTSVTTVEMVAHLISTVKSPVAVHDWASIFGAIMLLHVSTILTWTSKGNRATIWTGETFGSGRRIHHMRDRRFQDSARRERCNIAKQVGAKSVRQFLRQKGRLVKHGSERRVWEGWTEVLEDWPVIWFRNLEFGARLTRRPISMCSHGPIIRGCPCHSIVGSINYTNRIHVGIRARVLNIWRS